MKDESGNWLQQQPAWPCIVAKDGSTMNLEHYLISDSNTVSSSEKFGQVLSETEFFHRFIKQKSLPDSAKAASAAQTMIIGQGREQGAK